MELILNNKQTLRLKSGCSVVLSKCVDKSAKAHQADLLSKNVVFSTYQMCEWLECSSDEYLLMQVKDKDGASVGQLSILIKRSKSVNWYAYGLISHLGRSFTNESIEKEVLQDLPELLRKSTDISRIKIHSYCNNENDYRYMMNLLSALGFVQSKKSFSYTRTAVCSTEKSVEDFIEKSNQKTRAKFKHKSRSLVEIRPLVSEYWVPELQKCLDAAFARTGSSCEPYDFKTHLNYAEKYPNNCLLLGLFLKSRPDELLAYGLDVRHGEWVEATSSGSMPDAELRKTHFNYYLFLEKYEWAKKNGAKAIDLGGITPGGEDDPLASISSFKRNLTNQEQDVGMEFDLSIRAVKDWTFRKMVNLKESLRR